MRATSSTLAGPPWVAPLAKTCAVCRGGGPCGLRPRPLSAKILHFPKSVPDTDCNALLRGMQFASWDPARALDANAVSLRQIFNSLLDGGLKFCRCDDVARLQIPRSHHHLHCTILVWVHKHHCTRRDGHVQVCLFKCTAYWLQCHVPCQRLQQGCRISGNLKNHNSRWEAISNQSCASLSPGHSL